MVGHTLKTQASKEMVFPTEPPDDGSVRNGL